MKLKMRKIDKIEQCRAKIKLTDGRLFIGYGDCVSPLPIEENEDEEDDFLRFVSDDGENVFLRDDDISSYELL